MTARPRGDSAAPSASQNESEGEEIEGNRPATQHQTLSKKRNLEIERSYHAVVTFGNGRLSCLMSSLFQAEIMEQRRYASTEAAPSDRSALSPLTSEPETGLDGLLFERFLAGENAAFVTLFERHHRRLYLYCLKMVGSPEQAEDLVQETWERVARLRSRAPQVDNPVGFLLRIVRNLSLNHLKREQRISRIGDLDDSSQPVTSLRELSTEEEMVHLCMAKLSDDFREVLTLHLFCGYQHDEIAVMLGKSPEAIRKRASRAQQELRVLVMTMLEAERARIDPPNADRQEKR